jgi:hypothetical protein
MGEKKLNMAWWIFDTEDGGALLPPGLYNLGRHEDDDPVIVEVWV